MLYSYKRSVPGKLPYRIILSNGMTRTDPSTFTEEEIADAGYFLAPEKPTPSENQNVQWNGEILDWEIREKTSEELQDEAISKKELMKSKINSYRDEKINSGFSFNGNVYDSRPEDQKRISGAALLAFMALTNGAQSGDYLWHGGSEPFSWITQDNQIIQMDAETVVEFGKAAAEHERSYIFAARNLKDMDDIPENWQDSIYWP